MSTEQQDLRDRIAEVIRPQVFPTSQDNHVARWIADALMPVIAAELDAAREEGRRSALTEIADHFTTAHDVAAQGLDLIVPPDHMRKRANQWMAYLRWAGDHVRGYAEGTADLVPTAADELRRRQERAALLLQARIAELEEQNSRLQRLLAQARRDKWAARWEVAELQVRLNVAAATALTRHDKAYGHYDHETDAAPTQPERDG